MDMSLLERKRPLFGEHALFSSRSAKLRSTVKHPGNRRAARVTVVLLL